MTMIISSDKKEYLNPFQKKKGDTQGKNQIEQYLRRIFDLVPEDCEPEDIDIMGINELFSELTHEQASYISWILASYTGTKISKARIIYSDITRGIT